MVSKVNDIAWYRFLGLLTTEWLQYYLQFASKDSILFLDQHRKAEMLEISLMLVVGSIAADPSEAGPDASREPFDYEAHTAQTLRLSHQFCPGDIR